MSSAMAAANDKPLALLIPGLDGTGKLYYRQISRLSEVYRVRPWGFYPRDSFDLADLVEELASSTENEEPGSILMIAESFGGLIALQFALDYRERLKRLVLINTFPYYRRQARIRLACRLTGLLNKPPIRGLKDYIVNRALASEGILPKDREQYLEIIKRVYLPAYCRRLQLVRDVDLRDRLKAIRVPTCIFASGKDKLVPSGAEARLMASSIPDSRLYEFPSAGHALLLTPGFDLAEYLSYAFQ
jgi:pimeloyl-ACP methyl ester carboxylesterase